jgi:hypothetical protein
MTVLAIANRLGANQALGDMGERVARVRKRGHSGVSVSKYTIDSIIVRRTFRPGVVYCTLTFQYFPLEQLLMYITRRLTMIKRFVIRRDRCVAHKPYPGCFARASQRQE